MQLPSVQIDSVVETSDEIFIGNRNPQPGEVQIPAYTAVEFDIFGPADDLEISVNGVWALDFGSWENGWTGATVAVLPNITRIRLIPPEPYASGELQRIRVYQGNRARFSTWHFIAYDVTPPLIRSVQAINKDQIRVTFNEPVRMGDGEGPGDALNPLSYFIERVSRPAVMPAVASVEFSADAEVILTTALELTFGADYMLVVTAVEDEFGNPFVAPDNVAVFSGWLPPFPAGRRFLLHDMMPRMMLGEDSTQDLTLFLACIQDSANLLLHTVDKWLEIIDPDTAPEAFVDAILIDLGNPFTFRLDLNKKRRLAKVLVLMYRLKGTVAGITDAVRFFLGIEVTVETFVGTGWRLNHDQVNRVGLLAPLPAIIGPSGRALYSFRIRTAVVLTDAEREQIRDLAIYLKGAQEHLVGIKDASVPIIEPRYWTLNHSRVGFCRVAGGAHGVTPEPSTANDITSFVLRGVDAPLLATTKDVTAFTVSTP